LLQWRTLTGTTTYELGIETEFGTNDGMVVGTYDQMLGLGKTVMVPEVVKVFPGETI